METGRGLRTLETTVGTPRPLSLTTGSDRSLFAWSSNAEGADASLIGILPRVGET